MNFLKNLISKKFNNNTIFLNLLIAILFLLNSIAVNAELSKDKWKHWEKIKFNFSTSYVHTFLNPDLCYENARQLKACLSFLSSIAENLPEPAILIPNSLKKSSVFKVNNEVENFGAVSLVTLVKNEESNLTYSNYLKLKKEKENFEIRALEQLIYYRGMSPINFYMIFRSITAKIKSDIPQSYIMGTAVNRWLEINEDPHSRIRPYSEFIEEGQNPDSEIAGIGTHISSNEGKHIIVEVEENSPAQKAGLVSGDEIVEVDNIQVSELSINQLVSRIKGEVGTIVNLKINRNRQVLTYSVSRAKVVMQNVTLRTLSYFGIKIGYLRIKSFVDNKACLKIKKELKKLKSTGVNGLILDLRNNPGGFLTESVCITGLFVGKKLIVSQRDLDSNQQENYISGENEIIDLPVVTLINAGSASASEITSGALQDYHRSWLVGDRSYGKATVQAGAPFQPDSDFVYFKTIARFYLPSGRTNQIVGIEPDFKVFPKPNMTEEDMVSPREEDLNYIYSAMSEKWTQTRPKEVMQIQNCMNTNKLALTEFNKNAVVNDYQLLSGVEVLICAKKLGLN